MPQRHVYPNEAYQKRKAASFGFASAEGLAAPIPSRRPHAVSSYGAAVDRSRQEQRPQTDSSPRRQRDKMGRDTTARPHLPHTVRQKEKSQPRQPGHAEAGGVPHDAANEIPYLYTSHQQTVMAPAHRPEPATVLVVPNLPGQVKKEAHRGQWQKLISY